MFVSYSSCLIRCKPESWRRFYDAKRRRPGRVQVSGVFHPPFVFQLLRVFQLIIAVLFVD